MNNLIHKLKKEFFVSGITFLLISVLCIYKIYHLPSYPTGDGAEYILVTEAFYKHKSPDLRLTDSKSFKHSFTKALPWDSVYKPFVFDALQNFIGTPGKKFNESGDSFGGLYVATNGKIFGYHFFTYSLFNVPMRYFMSVLNKNPLSAFKITNTILILLTCFLILFFTPFNTFISSLIATAFYFSSSFWYLGWVHPELFTVCCVTIALWLFFQNHYYISLFIITIATTQNQPLVFLLLFMAISTLLNNGFKIHVILKVMLCCAIICIPPLFYYYHFGTFSIINKAGYLDSQYQTFNRIFGFYFDLNQGVILAIPLVLILYISIWVSQLYKTIKTKRKPSLELFLPLVLVAIAFTVSSMVVWNHGQSVINRYATWASAIIFIHFFFMIRGFKIKTQTYMVGLITLSQIFTALFHSDISKSENNCCEHKPIAIWTLNHFPSLYNPDPLIFGVRTTHEFGIEEETSPIVYFDKNKTLCKIMCHANRLNDLLAFGIPMKEIISFKENKPKLNGWIYINKGEFTTDSNKDRLYNTANYFTAKKIIIPKIKANDVWFNHVKESAKTNSITIDSALVVDALYALNLQKENKN